MKIIFIAGPFRGDGSIADKEKNVGIARKFVNKFIENNIPYYSPHLNIDQEVISLKVENDLALRLNTEMLKKLKLERRKQYLKMDF
jgi:putative NIF3 family GTP cyclohydrolase 1 type 2